MTNLVWQFCAVLQAAATSTLAKRSWRGHAFPLVLLVATMVASTAHAQNQSLFVPLPNNQLSDATPAQSTRLQTVRGDPAVVSVDLARVNLDALQGNTVTLALPGGAAVATNRQTIVRGPSDYTWIGDMAAGGQAVLVVQDGEVTGQVQSGLKTYEITPIGGGVHALTQVDQSRFPPDHPHAPPVPPSRGGDTQLAPTVAPAATLAQVDVLIAYTTNAKNAYGGNMPSFAQLSVDTANVAYSASNGAVIMRLVGTIEVTYTETTFDNALSDVTNGTGVMAAVHTKRDQVGADIVSLFINETDFCGLGWINSDQVDRLYDGVLVMRRRQFFLSARGRPQFRSASRPLCRLDQHAICVGPRLHQADLGVAHDHGLRQSMPGYRRSVVSTHRILF